MDKQALGMAIFMGLYVPLFTGISVTIHRFMQRKPQQNNKIIIVHRQFENQSFDNTNNNSIFKQNKSHRLSFEENVSEVKTFNFYKFLPPAYIRDNNSLQNIDLNKIVIDDSRFNLETNSLHES
ncbi:MAG: hypothetical protein MJK14_11970 [Rivularia sp. ALOHA_DT_140]|nr:hypothetical protein [Rivularia sp. ALOHA_DT_140]